MFLKIMKSKNLMMMILKSAKQGVELSPKIMPTYYISDVYFGVKDAVTGDTIGSGGTIDSDNVGKHDIIPSTFIGGQCHVAQCYQDAMTLARYFERLTTLSL